MGLLCQGTLNEVVAWVLMMNLRRDCTEDTESLVVMKSADTNHNLMNLSMEEAVAVLETVCSFLADSPW